MSKVSGRIADRGRIGAALAILVLLSVAGCRLFPRPFERNPKLRLLRSERDVGGSLYQPVVSPDGAQVYYLSWGDSSGVWRTGFSDTGAVQVLPGTFNLVALSPNGRLMVLVAYGGFMGNPLVTFDLGTAVAETILYDTDAYDLEFSRTVARRFYYSNRNTGLHWWDIDSSHDVLVDSTIRGYFDLTPTDSVVRGLYKPRVHPGGRYVACLVSSRDGGIALVDLATKDTVPLNAEPYKLGGVGSPYWTPDGKALVFSAAESYLGDPGGTLPAELWVLDSVFAK